MLDDALVASALAANPIIRGFTFIRWFNGSRAVDHLEASTGQNRIDLEKGLLEWTLAHGGGYEIVAYKPKAIAVRRGVTSELPTLEVWLPYAAWQRFR